VVTDPDSEAPEPVPRTRVPGGGMLSIVATPIGNLEDITLRALRILREADVILAEDTRHTLKLCRHHGIGGPLRALHAHTSDDRIEAIAQELAGGARLALVSDAGTPLISDPGAALVARAVALGVTVEAIPGPSAPIAALVSSGLAAPAFTFAGFLPRSGGRRTRAIEALSRAPGAIVLFEAPNRLAATLRDLASVLGADRPAAVCRELTKLHEEIARGALSELAERFAGGALGEITLVISARDPIDDEGEEVSDDEIRAWLEDGLGTKEAADRLAARERVPRKEAYRKVLRIAEE
jgi:16S rRNA (cytidine1402-2'-O)-methyltransferase